MLKPILNQEQQKGPEGPESATKESDNSLLYGILTMILAVIMLVLLQVNANLKKLSDDKSGIPAHEPIPFYRNKAYLTVSGSCTFCFGRILSRAGRNRTGPSAKLPT